MPLKTVNAFQAGVKTLYHYQPFIPEYLADMLTRQRIHCATPGKLNDPWDCQHWYDFDCINDPAVREDYIDWLNQFGDGPPTPQNRMKISDLLATPENLTRSIEELSLEAQKQTALRRIYCLTPHPDSILMWSHYSQNHSGVCLEFDTANPLFSGTMQVSYLTCYPKLIPHEMSTDQALIVLLSKSDAWQYEDEYRLIGMPHAPAGAPMQLEGDFLTLPAGALTAVIMGCRADYEKIERFFKGHAPSIKLKKAVLARNYYRLDIVGRT